MKKGQLMSQPFVYIFALIVGALVLAYGVYVLYDLVSQTNEVQVLEAIEDLDDIVQTYNILDEGSTKKWRLSFPGEVDSICFYDNSKTIACKLDGMNCDPDDLSDGFSLYLSDNNVYLLPLTLSYNRLSYDIDNLKPENGNPLCVSNGKEIWLESKQDYVGVSIVE